MTQNAHEIAIADAKNISLAYTLFPDTSAASKRDKKGTWADIVGVLSDPPRRPTKAACPMLKLATFGDVRSEKGALRSDDNLRELSGLVGDYDEGRVSVDEAARRLEGAGVEAFLYSSARHTSDAPRWRVLAPLSQPHAPVEHGRLMAMLNEALGGILASESFTRSQTYFYGRVDGVHYEHRHVPGGSCIDELDLVLGGVGPVGRSLEAVRGRAAEAHSQGGDLDEADRMLALSKVNDETINELRSALAACAAVGDADKGSRGEWINKAHYLRSLEEAGFELWCEFSNLGDAPDSEEELRARFYGCDGSRSDYRSVFVRAQSAAVGWVNPKSRKADGVLNYTQAMEQLNERHASALVGGTFVVIRENEDDLPDFLSRSAFETYHAARKFQFVKTDKKTGMPVTEVGKAAPAWIESDLRRTYSGVEFAPGGGRKGYYNLFRGFAVEPAAGDCSLFLSHLRDNICQGDAAQFDYVIRWLADLVQNPGTKPGVAISISGKKGTGKSKLTDTIAALLGTHAVTVSNADQLTGRFNAHHSTALLITGEESFWAGDKKAEGALKHMITSEKIALEKKGVDIAMIDNYSRFIFVGNAEWLFPATNDERRLFALECGDAHRLDYDYFAAIDAQLYGAPGLKRVTQGVTPAGLNALLAHLLAIDLRGWQIRAVPETNGLKAQRSATLEPHFQFLYEAIASHDLAGHAWGDEMRIAKPALYERFVEVARKRGATHPCDERVFGRRITETFGWGTVQSSDGRRYWKVTDWNASKAAFERTRKVSFDDEQAEIETDLGAL